MFSLTTSITLAAAMQLIDRMKLMEMPSSALVGYCVNISIAIFGLWVAQTILQRMTAHLVPWQGLLKFAEDTVAQTSSVLMLVLSNCVVKISMWYSGEVWIDVVQVMLAISVVQTLQYRVPAITSIQTT